ncbi:uncharacterized protein EAE97_005957 [Botrytis byssoidea]|uniref:Uncharacterized protein n=1 Tax=Botrytis byssoidea TaxID=139641 RepID=A0A9P5IJT2_9HELO|nr:uncharacterized protein EAE97_005957 [Botrytis byssoidea]KAF7943887.1 hypothetical protein EAE97_005957 [Botrytis byssoidea]
MPYHTLCDALLDSLVRNQYTDRNLREYTKSQSPRMEVTYREITNADCCDDEYEDLEKNSTDIISGPDLKQREIDSKPEDSILERLPYDLREMVFVFCGRSTFCSAGQGPNLLKALRGQRQAYAHALRIFERLNSYELGAELRNPTSEICNEIQDMTGLMTVNEAPRSITCESESNDSKLAESDLELTLHGRIHKKSKYSGDPLAPTTSTVLHYLVRHLLNANCIRDVQFYHDISRTKERTSRIILCQNDRGDWTFLKNFFTFVTYGRVKRVITQLPNPQNHCVKTGSRYDAYYQDNYYESYRAQQDAFVLAVIESISQKVGVEGVVLGRSKDSLSGFCIWEAPEGECMSWNRDVIEPWALRGGFGKNFLDYENNHFELGEDTSRRCFMVRNRHE